MPVPLLAQRDVATDDRHDVRAFADLRHDLLGDSTHSVPRSETDPTSRTEFRTAKQTGPSLLPGPDYH